MLGIICKITDILNTHIDDVLWFGIDQESLFFVPYLKVVNITSKFDAYVYFEKMEA